MTEKKRKLDEEVEESPAKVRKPKSKKQKSFDVKLFRKSLKTNDFIFEVKGFVSAANDDPTLVQEFLDSKGTLLELVVVLQKIDSSNLQHLASMFDAIQLVLLEIANDQSRKMVAESGLNFLMNNHRSLILKVLQSEETSHRMVVLKMLTGAAVLGVGAVQILRLFDTLERSVEETIFHGFQMTEQTLGDNLRKSYIQLIMSFLIEAEHSVISQVMQRDYLIRALMKGLVYDELSDVGLILNTFTGILEHETLTKTQKKRAFSEESVKAILDVYKWKGPEFLIHKTEKLVDLELRKEAADIAHAFLTILLTSRRHGIAFKALGREGKFNVVQKLVLRHLKYFWNDAHASDLVQKMVTACPEQIGVLMDRLTFGIQPKMNESWFCCVLFTQNLIETVDVVKILRPIAGLEPKKITEYILNHSLCHSILQHIDETALLRGHSVEMRDQLVQLLLIMLRKCNEFLIELQKMKIIDYDLKKIKFNVINQIFSYYPNVETLLNAMYESIKRSDRSSEECRSQLHATLDIILLLNEMVPSMIQNDQNIINYINVLRPIYDYQGSAEVSEERLEMNLKVVKLILLLEPDALNIKNSLFEPVFQTLIKVFTTREKVKLSGGAQVLLQQLLLSTEHFDELLEVNVLLNALLQLKGDAVKTITKFLLRVMKEAKLSKVNVEAKLENVDFNALFERIEKTAVKEVETVAQSSLSLFFPTLIKESKNLKDATEFLDHFALGLFFTVPDKSLIVETFNQIDSPLKKYFIKSQLANVPISEPISKYIQSLLSSTFVPQLLDLNTDTELTFYLQITIFVVIELTKKAEFSVTHRTNCMDYVRKIFEVKKSLKDQIGNDENAELEEKQATSHEEFIVQYIFCQQYQLLEYFGFQRQELSMFVTELSHEIKGHFTGSEKYFGFYRSKLMSELDVLIKASDSTESALQIVEAFEFSDAEILELIHKILQVKLKKANKPFLLSLLVYGLNNLQQSYIPCEDMEKLGSTILKLDALEQLEEPLLEYLTKFSESSLPVEIFESLFGASQRKSAVRLACLMLERDSTLQENFRDLILNNLEKKEIVYPLINVAAYKGLLSDSDSEGKKFLGKLYTEFKAGILKTVDKPQKVGVIYKENVLSSVVLVALCMPTNECIDFCGKAVKFNGVEVYQLQIVMAIYFKAVKSIKDPEKLSSILSTFINNYVTLFNFILKKEGSIVADVTAFTYILERFLKLFEDAQFEPDSEQLLSSSTWPTYVKGCLRLGMNEKSDAAPIILRQLATICNWVYPAETTDVSNYFDLIFNHSEFFNIALNTQSTALKENLFRLVLIMAQRNGDVLQEKHLRVFLGAYQATLSNADRYILALIQLYESWDFVLPRPLLWGESAILQYSLRDSEPQDLLNKKTNTEVLALIDAKMVLRTFTKFPVWRKLNAGDQPPTVKSLEIDGNMKALQKFVEQSEEDSEDRTEREMKNEEIYDPAFIIPLLNMLFGPEQSDMMASIVFKNLMSVLFVALSSKDAEMRLAAANALGRAKAQLDGAKQFRGKELWVRVFETVQGGLAAIPPQKDITVPRPNIFGTLFIGHTVNILHNASDDLFPILSNYFVVKPVFDFTTVPEFFNLFFNNDIKFAQYRLFLLTLIKDGMQTIEDFLFLFKTPILKVIMACFGSPLSDTETDLAILEVLKKVALLPLAADVLIVKFGILTWLNGVIDRQETWFFDTICSIVDVLENLWYAVQENRTNYKDPEEVERKLRELLLTLLPKLTVKIPGKTYETFYRVLYKSCRGNFDAMEKENYETMLKYVESPNRLRSTT